MKILDRKHDTKEWHWVNDPSRVTLKAVLLHYENKLTFVAVAHATNT
jgi:hypothetical protein